MEKARLLAESFVDFVLVSRWLDSEEVCVMKNLSVTKAIQ
jgi:hypothetical protein